MNIAKKIVASPNINIVRIDKFDVLPEILITKKYITQFFLIVGIYYMKKKRKISKSFDLRPTKESKKRNIEETVYISREAVNSDFFPSIKIIKTRLSTCDDDGKVIKKYA